MCALEVVCRGFLVCCDYTGEVGIRWEEWVVEADFVNIGCGIRGVLGHSCNRGYHDGSCDRGELHFGMVMAMVMVTVLVPDCPCPWTG